MIFLNSLLTFSLEEAVEIDNPDDDDPIKIDNVIKYYYPEPSCLISTLRAARLQPKDNEEKDIAVICACADGEQGRGWYCLG